MFRILCVWCCAPAVMLTAGLQLSLFASACGAAVIVPNSATKSALVIGNADYSSAGALTNAIHDAQDMCAMLRSLGYLTSCHFDIRTRVQFRSIVQDFAESLRTDSVALIYYAGHAAQIRGENFLVPVDARASDDASLVGASLGLGFLMDQLRQTRALLKIVILDACRNDPQSASRPAPSEGLAQITDAPDATIVFYATAANEVALDGAGRNGILTKNILLHLRDVGSIDDLFKKVSSGVQIDSGLSGKSQKPALYTNFTGQYCFVRCTEIEELQAQQETNARKMAELQVRVASGDTDAKARLDAITNENSALIAEIRKKDEESRVAAAAAEKQVQEKQKKAYVPAAF